MFTGSYVQWFIGSYAYVSGLLRLGVLTFRGPLLPPRVFTFMSSFVKGFLRSQVLRFIGSYVHVFLCSRVLTFSGS